MNIATSRPRLAVWLARHPKARQWLWFVALWCGGLLAVTAATYPLEWLSHFLQH